GIAQTYLFWGHLALREPPSTITTAVAVSCTRSNKGANRVKKRKIQAPHGPCLTISACVQDPVSNKVTFLVSFLLLINKMKAPITKTHMLMNKVVSVERFHALISKMDLTFDRKLSNDKDITKDNLATEEEIWEEINVMKALRDEEGKSQGKIAARVGSTATVSVHYRAKAQGCGGFNLRRRLQSAARGAPGAARCQVVNLIAHRPVRVLLPTRVIMSQLRPQYSYDQCQQTFSESQGLEITQISKALEETQLSSHPVMPGDLKEASGACIPSTPQGPQNFCSSSIAIKATSPTKSDEGSNSQEREDTLSTSQAVLDPKNVPIDALDKQVAMLVDFLLFKYQMKEPITKADMLKVVIKECEVHFPEILLRASERMEMIFGLDLMEVDHTNHHYGLFIKLGLTYDGMLHVERGVPKTGLLILILSVIFMKGNRATEDEVWEVLNVTGLYSGRKHFIFREPRELITKEFKFCPFLKDCPLSTYTYVLTYVV
ncbi:hypothetical protein E2I00_012817, partial [Balaenoptera physalus]